MAARSSASKQGAQLLSSMELHQPYTGIVVQAVGVASKFSTFVRNTEHDELINKYLQIKELKDKRVPKDLKMTKAETIIAENLLAKRAKEKSKKAEEGPKLDAWQTQALDLILSRKSVAIFGPTSGGKTYLVKYAINELRSHVRRAIFVAPTFHLALQTYSDIQATYTGFPASLITDKMNEYHRDSWIYVGTAECLLNFLESTNEDVDVAIFDEIHSLNTAVVTDTAEMPRITATHTLLGKCRKQIIALSATVHPDDKDRVVQYLQERTGIEAVHPVGYTQRAVPQKMFVWNNKGMLPLDENKKRVIPAPVYTPESMFQLILTMRAHGMFPTLLFGMENMTFQAFSDLISYIEMEEHNEYKRYHALGQSLNPFIEDFNTKVFEFQSSLASFSNLPPEVQAHCDILQENRIRIIQSCLDRVKDDIRKVFTMIDESEDGAKYAVPLPDWNKGVVVDGIDLDEIDPSPELVDLCDLYKSYYHCLDAVSPLPEQIPCVPETKGSFFRFGANTHYVFNDMRQHRKTEEITKFKSVITTMAKAEGIDERLMWKFIDMVGRGLDFGISALLTEFPFFIQYQILQMIKDKSLAAVFASESMSMGINYPLRSVVVFSPTLKEYPVSHLLQMAGRCGRRGMDKKSFVVYWGIKNAQDTVVEHIDFNEDEYELPQESVPILLTLPKHVIQGCYTRYHSEYDDESKSTIRSVYKDKCVAEYQAIYSSQLNRTPSTI